MLNSFIKKNFHQRFQSTFKFTRNTIVKKPIDWNDLIEWIENGQKTPLWRDEYNTRSYFEHQKYVSEHYKSLNDFIRINYLKWDIDIDKSTEKRIAIPNLNSIKDPLLTPNKFPYYLVDNIKHWLIWCDPKPEQWEKLIEKIINKEFPSNIFQTISFVNPPRLRTISGVFHAHVFTRKLEK